MYFIRFFWLYAVLFFSITSQVKALENSAIETELQQLIKNTSDSELWKDIEWLNLLHYQGGPDFNDYISQVDDPVFFNAQDGKTNPKNELEKTLKSFYNTNIINKNKHAQCRFIARFSWLKNKYPNSFQQLPNISCDEYTKWRKEVPEEKVSLIFPAYHLNSPSSMFGHTLLRIDPADSEQASTWLSTAVNFGANIQSSDNSIFFAVKGLAGGYSGTFIVAPYYEKIKEYNRQENRDIWEYPLNLTPEETKRIVLHLWELKNIKFDYYFFDENCSYRLLELLQVARPELKLTQQFGLTAIPIDTVRSIEQANLMTDTVYRPSQTTSINYLLDKLSSTQRELVLKVSRNAELIHSESFLKNSIEEKNIIIDTAYRYLRYQQNDDGRSELNAKNSFLLLNAINKTEKFSSKNITYSESQRPEKGHLSKKMAITVGDDNDQSFAQLDFRMSFHSLEDNLKGFLEGAQINIGSLSIRATEDEMQLQQLDLIDIFSLTPRNDFFQPLSWKVYTGLEQQIINGEDHLTAHVTAGVGASYNIWSNNLVYGLLTTRLETSSQYSQAIEPALGISTGLLQHFSFGTGHIEISGEEFYHDEFRHRIKYTQNFNLQRNHAVQLSFLRQHQTDLYFTEAQLSYHYFFH
ncbi:MAG: hypothetical protein DIZ80_09115 [endosymbiont of Galathealinum brachiosum]|uniref:Uncharacterized protein n=1 Tax=endosymbiont of Galathealinum brachiosum TaxID=2200906 RepID=A0A370DC06_9GAMM|nr:MAG: hypothetical protein DIZ80_09115 [endosymbiont of Galathealinum brachiosum]